MKCVKTGAVVFFPEYGCQVAADLYKVDGVTIVRFPQNQWQKYFGDEGANYVAYIEDGWWRPDLGVLVGGNLFIHRGQK